MGDQIRQTSKIFGIRRNAPDNVIQDGASEELINLRRIENAWRPVGVKDKRYTGVETANFDITRHFKHPEAPDGCFLGYNASGAAIYPHSILILYYTASTYAMFNYLTFPTMRLFLTLSIWVISYLFIRRKTATSTFMIMTLSLVFRIH